MSLIVDPEIKKLHRRQTANELRMLEDDLKANGCQEPILVWQGTGKIVDGFGRYEICERLGIGCRTKEIAFSSMDAVRVFVRRRQGGRRNLTPGDMKVNAAELAKLLGEDHEHAPKAAADERAADATGVSAGTVARTRRIIAKAAPEVAQAIRDGQLTLGVAEQVAELPQAQQRTAVAGGRTPARKAVFRKPKGLFSSDALGNAVSGTVAEAFAEAKKLSSLRAQLTKALKVAEQASLAEKPGWVWLDAASFAKAVKAAIAELAEAAPAALCPYCRGNGCPRCTPASAAACGYMSAKRYGEVPEAESWAAKAPPARPQRSGGTKQPYADAFCKAYDTQYESTVGKYVMRPHDWVLLASWRKDHPDVTPEQFAAVAKSHWDRGEYTPKAALEVASLCRSWASLAAKAAEYRNGSPKHRQGAGRGAAHGADVQDFSDRPDANL